jgi:hypothetical protein
MFQIIEALRLLLSMLEADLYRQFHPCLLEQKPYILIQAMSYQRYFGYRHSEYQVCPDVKLAHHHVFWILIHDISLYTVFCFSLQWNVEQ